MNWQLSTKNIKCKQCRAGCVMHALSFAVQSMLPVSIIAVADRPGCRPQTCTLSFAVQSMLPVSISAVADRPGCRSQNCTLARASVSHFRLPLWARYVLCQLSGVSQVLQELRWLIGSVDFSLVCCISLPTKSEPCTQSAQALINICLAVHDQR